jgi:hypothetical protein
VKAWERSNEPGIANRWKLVVSKSIGWISIALIGALAGVASADRMAFAQAGSTGGTIGKTDKSVSGTEEPEKAHLQRRNSPSRVSDNRVRPPAGSSLVGRWQVHQSCAAGKSTSQVEIRQSPGGQFVGVLSGRDSFGGTDTGKISNGQVQGDKATFMVARTNSTGSAVRQWSATLIRTSGVVTRMEGSFFGLIANCTFNATRN